MKYTLREDKQLWRLADNVAGRDYSWPLYATPALDKAGLPCCYVELALPVEDQAQYDFVCTRLNPVAFEQENVRWLLRERLLEQVALHCSGITPDYYRKWPDKHAGGTPLAAPDGPLAPPPCTDEDYVRYCCARAGLTDYATAKTYWGLFSYHALNWLLEEQRSLNLGYASLTAVPYRANWRSILHARWPNVASLFKRTGKEREAALEAVGFHAALYSGDLASMTTEQTFGWTLEVLPHHSFRDTAQAMENEALAQSLEAGSYARRWSRYVKAKHDILVKLFAHWLAQASYPLARVSSLGQGNFFRLVPRRSRGRVRPVGEGPPPSYFTTAAHTPEHEPVSPPILDAATAEGVSEMPDADLGVQLVRPAR